jgi:hypothetical protein
MFFTKLKKPAATGENDENEVFQSSQVPDIEDEVPVLPKVTNNNRFL